MAGRPAGRRAPHFLRHGRGGSELPARRAHSVVPTSLTRGSVSCEQGGSFSPVDLYHQPATAAPSINRSPEFSDFSNQASAQAEGHLKWKGIPLIIAELFSESNAFFSLRPCNIINFLQDTDRSKINLQKVMLLYDSLCRRMGNNTSE